MTTSDVDHPRVGDRVEVTETVSWYGELVAVGESEAAVRSETTGAIHRVSRRLVREPQLN